MLFYEYFCAANGRTAEVAHRLKVRLKTWGEVCRLAGIEPGSTPLNAPVVRLIGGSPQVLKLKGLDKDAPPGGKLEV